ncbi:MAG: hypothetical protein DIJKHBIC_04243 [Thermoanaerobaculia bacterium]|nr:hypothetical protein [Thermoanaerobaculia bacterium]
MTADTLPSFPRGAGVSRWVERARPSLPRPGGNTIHDPVVEVEVSRRGRLDTAADRGRVLVDLWDSRILWGKEPSFSAISRRIRKLNETRDAEAE